MLADRGDGLAVGFIHRGDRHIEKLATPDVTIADIIGDERTIHYGLLPRANRGIFAITCEGLKLAQSASWRATTRTCARSS